MSRLLQTAELEHTAELVKREADRLLVHARAARDELDAAERAGDGQLIRIRTSRLARIARQLTRAQAVLVHSDDPRFRAAQAVIGYCDEADKAAPWEAPAPPLQIGVAS